MTAYRVLLVALLAVTAGCSSFKRPGIAVLDATLVETSSEAVRFDVELEIMYPNDEAMELREFSYTFAIRGVPSFRGRWSMGRTLGPGHRSRLKLPAVVAVDPQAVSEPAWTIRGNVLYVSPGALAEILLDSQVREPRARFSGQGTARAADVASR